MTQGGFFDIFRRVLGWKSAMAYTPEEQDGVGASCFVGMVYNASAEAGTVHAPGAAECPAGKE